MGVNPVQVISSWLLAMKIYRSIYQFLELFLKYLSNYEKITLWLTLGCLDNEKPPDNQTSLSDIRLYNQALSSGLTNLSLARVQKMILGLGIHTIVLETRSPDN